MKKMLIKNVIIYYDKKILIKNKLVLYRIKINNPEYLKEIKVAHI